MQSGVRGLVGYGRFWLCGGGRAWGGWRGLSDMIPDVGPGDGERRRRVIHSEQRWPPLKRTFNKPKPWNIEAREKKRTAKYNARRKQVDKEMENYTPPSLLETIEKSKALRYEWKLSNRLRLSSIKGTGPNTGEMEEGTASDVYTEHTEDSLGVDPAGPNTMFAVFIIGARQVRAVKGDIIYSEKIPFRINEKIRLSKVLLCATRYWSVIGRPLVHNASVVATVEEQLKTKLIKRMFRGRKHRRRYGHRQQMTRMRIERIDYTPPSDSSMLEPLIAKPTLSKPPRRRATNMVV